MSRQYLITLTDTDAEFFEQQAGLDKEGQHDWQGRPWVGPRGVHRPLGRGRLGHRRGHRAGAVMMRQPSVVVVVSTWPWGYRPYLRDLDRLAWVLIGWPVLATAWLLVWSLVAVAWLSAEFYCLLGSLVWYIAERVRGGRFTIEKMELPLGLRAWASVRETR